MLVGSIAPSFVSAQVTGITSVQDQCEIAYPTNTTTGSRNTLGLLLCRVALLINTVIPVLISLGVVYFIWGVIHYAIARDEEGKAEGRANMINGLIALLVIAVQQIADLNEAEVNIYNTILLKKESRTLSNLAAKIIQTFWRLTQKRRKKEQRFFIVIKLFKLLKDFRIKYTRIRSKYYVGMKKNIQIVERQSKVLIKGLSRELNSADSYSSTSLKMVVKQCEISEKISALKSNYRRMFHMLAEDKNIENSARLLSSARNSDNNTLALFKKRRDKAMKKLLMRYSNSPSSNSSMLSPHN